MMRKNSAITFIELLVVIIIIGILAGVSIPHLKKTFDNFELENFVKDIYYLTHYLQTSAISQGKTHCLNINKEKAPIEFHATYQIENEQGEKIFQAVEGRFGKPYQVPEGIEITLEKDKTEIYFYPDGSTGEIEMTFENNHGHKVSLKAKGASGGIKIE